jgi:hypothetical protein
VSLRKLPSSIVVTKVDAAFNQIIAAIDMLRIGRYECAITLAGAAEGMFPKTEQSIHSQLMMAPVHDELRSTFYATLNQTQRNRFWNAERDWLKHCNVEHPPELTIARLDAEGMIARALTKLSPRIPIPLPPDAEPVLRSGSRMLRNSTGHLLIPRMQLKRIERTRRAL